MFAARYYQDGASFGSVIIVAHLSIERMEKGCWPIFGLARFLLDVGVCDFPKDHFPF
jgi:hypothetical protein